MNGSYLLDTNVFINSIRHKLQLPVARYAYSIITELELLSFRGLSLADEQAIRAVLCQLTRVELNEQVKEKTIHVRRSTQMRLPDSIISASTLVIGAKLVTDDVKLAQKHGGDVISLEALLKV